MAIVDHLGNAACWEHYARVETAVDKLMAATLEASQHLYRREGEGKTAYRDRIKAEIAKHTPVKRLPS